MGDGIGRRAGDRSNKASTRAANAPQPEGQSQVDRLISKGGYPADEKAAITEALNRLAQRDDGWLRMVPSRDRSPVYLKWKFNRGPWGGHYVMATVQYWQLGYGFMLLMAKLDDVDAGRSKAVQDRPYAGDYGDD